VRVNIDHKPNTPLSDFSESYGVAPHRRHGNRIGGHKKKRSFLYGTVRPRVISECGNMNNPRPLACEACLTGLALTQQVSMPWNRHHGTESHQNQKDQNPDWCSAPLDSPQYGQLSVAMGSLPEHASVHTPAELESPYRCDRTIRSWKGRSGSSTSPIGLAVHEYHLTCVHIHMLMNNEFSTLVLSQNNQNSNKSDSCPRTRLRYSPVTRLQSHKEPLGSRRRSYRQIRATPLMQW
jgi:hypothetical protein